jgi:hypothetical protein
MLVLETDHRDGVYSSQLGWGKGAIGSGLEAGCLVSESIINVVLSEFGSGMHK